MASVALRLVLVAVAFAGCVSPASLGEGDAALEPVPAGPSPEHGTNESVVHVGHIWVGSRTTEFRSTNVLQRTATCLVPVAAARCAVPADGIDSFFFAVPEGTATLTTHTTTSQPAVRFGINVWFRDAAGEFMDDQPCATGSRDEHHCVVPEGAVLANADAVEGVDLTVTVVTP